MVIYWLPHNRKVLGYSGHFSGPIVSPAALSALPPRVSASCQASLLHGGWVALIISIQGKRCPVPIWSYGKISLLQSWQESLKGWLCLDHHSQGNAQVDSRDHDGLMSFDESESTWKITIHSGRAWKDTEHMRTAPPTRPQTSQVRKGGQARPRFYIDFVARSKARYQWLLPTVGCF